MKFLKILLIPALCMFLMVNTAASYIGSGVYEFADEEKVVTFDENSKLSAEEQQMIAEYLVYGVPEDDGVSTYAWCWLTGHDYTYDVVYVVTHKKQAYSPRCYRETYSIETCTKCDHFEEEWITGVYIVCCPEE